MKIKSKTEFDILFKDSKLVISLIGMSGIGKTTRAKRLKKFGFKHICCDDLIAKGLGFKKTLNVAKWMGQPYSKNYAQREKKYLQQEEMVTKKSLQNVNQNTILDTTGSVIYLSQKTKSLLKKSTLIVYLQENQALRDQLFKIYITDPKPVVWDSKFNIKKNESQKEALARCYNQLIKSRSLKYQRLANIILPSKLLMDKKMNKKIFDKQFIHAIRNELG